MSVLSYTCLEQAEFFNCIEVTQFAFVFVWDFVLEWVKDVCLALLGFSNLSDAYDMCLLSWTDNNCVYSGDLLAQFSVWQRHMDAI